MDNLLYMNEDKFVICISKNNDEIIETNIDSNNNNELISLLWQYESKIGTQSIKNLISNFDYAKIKIERNGGYFF